MVPLKKVGILLGPLSFLIVLLFFRPDGLSEQGVAVLACTFWMAIWWVLEVIPISATALLPLVLFPLSGALDIGKTSASFGHKYVFLYLGGFMIAMAIEKWQLHRRIALMVINLIGTDISKIILGFMVATAFMSMWISNTATAVMMLPIGMAIITQLKDNPLTQENETEVFGKSLMLAIAYSASIGGLASLIGTPPNLVFAGVIEKLYNIEVTFSQWIIFGLPISTILLIICWQYLIKYAFPIKQKEFPGGKAEIKRLVSELGVMSTEEKSILVVFLITALLWITRSFLSTWLPELDDTIIAMLGGLALFIIPSSKVGEKLMAWEDMKNIPWGIILLFGGGMALASGFENSGLANWLGEKMVSLENLPVFIILLVIVAAVNFLTELTSNLATAAMLLPILAPLAFSLDVHPFLFMVGATMAASCAFMLPIATPPNAVVFGSGYLTIPDMMRAGFWLNIFSIFLIFAITYFLLPLLWDFNAFSFPKEFILDK
ncbi:solute carrier family 13 (sodium-dependent dicarboxylate transporter), member 2/3/5 [Spirosomataceae bacterium TFI 002]|nr:solute carrier family 13 (sodium-dependent dicarboxylate transporter), member 2/3/5 [Spirosomataceae bacterium TFI 002]